MISSQFRFDARRTGRPCRIRRQTRGEKIGSKLPRCPARFNVLGYRRLGHRRLEIEATAAGSIGLLLGLAACVAIVLLVRAAA